eukprot:g599.t1
MLSLKRALLLLALLFLAQIAFSQDDIDDELTEEERLEREEQRVVEIREHLLAGNAFEIQRALANVTNQTTLARGFRFEPEDAAIFLRETPERIGDPDVVSIRAFAQVLINGTNPEVLAEVFTLVLSLQGDRYLTNPAGTFMGLFESFSNATEMQRILDADPTEVDEEEERRRFSLRRKMLARGTPADTTLCARCFEKKFCGKNAPWC